MLELLVLIQNTPPSAGGTGVIENVYQLLQDGGLLMGALFVLYGQHKFYRYMIDKLEEKHTSQIQYLEGQLEELSREARERSRQDSLMIRDLTRNATGGNN